MADANSILRLCYSQNSQYFQYNNLYKWICSLLYQNRDKMLFVSFPYGLNKIDMASNEYCFVAHLHIPLYSLHYSPNNLGLCDYYSVDLLHPPCKIKLNDVIKKDRLILGIYSLTDTP